VPRLIPDDQLIQSPANENARRLRRLAHRREPGFALLEGPRVVAEAVRAGVELDLVVVREGDKSPLRSGPRLTFTRELFESVSQTATPQGVLAIAKVRESTIDEAIAAARAAGWPLVVLDGVQDPGNVGAICRTAAAAGAPALAVLGGTADPFGAKAVRASAGNVFRLVVAHASWKQLAGLDAYGAASEGGMPIALAPVENCGVIAFGSEARGLSRADLELVTIPVSDGVESLNVAAAAAVILFEIRRRKVV
jgi:TrmH family RNA methyltransferase